MSPVLFADHLRTFRNARSGEGFRPRAAGLLLVVACLAGFAMLTFQTAWFGTAAPQARAAAEALQEIGE